MSAADDHLRNLMQASQGGDKRAYSQLLTECEKWLRRYFARKIGPGAVDDLVQETLISVHRKRATYDPDRPFLPWLAAIGRYRWVDHLRKIYRSDEVGMVDEVTEDPEADHAGDTNARLSVDHLLAQIPEKQAEVIRLVKIVGMSITEAAERTGQSESLVKVNIHRGIKKMNSLIET